MARLVLLSFANNAEAENFARHAVQNNGTAINTIVPSSAKVEWVCGMPTRSCECSQQAAATKRRRRNRGGTSSDGYRKGTTFGWWVHANCGRVSRMVLERFITYKLTDAYDLLPTILGDPDRVPNDSRQYGYQVDRGKTKR